MVFRKLIRRWANAPTRKERLEIEQKEQEARQKGQEESAIVRGLKKENKLLDELLEKSYAQIRAQSEIISQHKEGDWMDKLIDRGLDIADNVFGKPKTTIDITKQSPSLPHTTTHTEEQHGEDTKPTPSVSSPYSDEEIKGIVESLDFEQIQKAAKAPYILFSKSLKNHYPEASAENLLLAYNLVQERHDNGK